MFTERSAPFGEWSSNLHGIYEQREPSLSPSRTADTFMSSPSHEEVDPLDTAPIPKLSPYIASIIQQSAAVKTSKTIRFASPTTSETPSPPVIHQPGLRKKSILKETPRPDSALRDPMPEPIAIAKELKSVPRLKSAMRIPTPPATPDDKPPPVLRKKSSIPRLAFNSNARRPSALSKLPNTPPATPPPLPLRIRPQSPAHFPTNPSHTRASPQYSISHSRNGSMHDSSPSSAGTSDGTSKFRLASLTPEMKNHMSALNALIQDTKDQFLSSRKISATKVVDKPSEKVPEKATEMMMHDTSANTTQVSSKQTMEKAAPTEEDQARTATQHRAKANLDAALLSARMHREALVYRDATSNAASNSPATSVAPVVATATTALALDPLRSSPPVQEGLPPVPPPHRYLPQLLPRPRPTTGPQIQISIQTPPKTSPETDVECSVNSTTLALPKIVPKNNQSDHLGSPCKTQAASSPRAVPDIQPFHTETRIPATDLQNPHSTAQIPASPPLSTTSRTSITPSAASAATATETTASDPVFTRNNSDTEHDPTRDSICSFIAPAGLYAHTQSPHIISNTPYTPSFSAPRTPALAQLSVPGHSSTPEQTSALAYTVHVPQTQTQHTTRDNGTGETESETSRLARLADRKRKTAALRERGERWKPWSGERYQLLCDVVLEEMRVRGGAIGDGDGDGERDNVRKGKSDVVTTVNGHGRDMSTGHQALCLSPIMAVV